MSDTQPQVIDVPPDYFNVFGSDDYTFNFTDATGYLTTLGPTFWTGEVTGFQAGDQILIEDIPESWTSLAYNQLTQTLNLVNPDDTVAASVKFAEPYAGYYTTASFSVVKLSASNPNLVNFDTITTDVACFVSGTRILTRTGEVAVESLTVGQEVVTASGALRPVRWIGHRQLAFAAYADPSALWPYRIRAGAFGRGVPTSDLLLSPGHSIASDGVLVAVDVLANGCTVLQEPVDRVTYWHVELDSHDVLLAHGLAVESYLDTGNRTSFANGGDCLDLHPEFATPSDAPTCLPLRREGPEVTATRQRLLDEIAARGHATTTDPQLLLLADGVAVTPWTIDASGCAFLVPQGCTSLRLASRVWVPQNLVAESCDQRRLGVRVSRLVVDGHEVGLDTLGGDAPHGWYPVEQDAAGDFRWTDGGADLPVGRVILLEASGGVLYPMEDASASGPALPQREAV